MTQDTYNAQTRLHQNESVEESQRRLALAIEAAEIGTFYCPMPLSVIYWNSKCKEHFWLPPDAHVDFDLFYSRIHPEDRERTRNAVNAAVHAGVPYDVEYRTLSPEGDIRWIRAKGSTRYDRAGKATRFDGVTIDISVQKRLEADRDRLLEKERLERLEAEQASHVKDTFLATVSHELRTPLTAVLAWAELLERRASEPDFVKKGADVVRRNVASQTRLVDDLLDVSRISSGKLAIATRPMLLSHAMLAELRELGPLAERKGVTVRNHMSSELPIMGDAVRLRQVFANLLSNALKYTPAGGTIVATTEVVGNDVIATVTDDGEGIPHQLLDRIFQPFAQVDGSTTRKHGGLGLGLSIARSIIGMHGGTLKANSNGPGTGATFIVKLPKIGLPFHGQTNLRHDQAESAPVALNRASVLLVDDDTDALEAFAMILRDEGVVALTATSPSGAREVLTANNVDVIVSDISMPGEDGYQFIAALRAAGCRTPAIAVTAFAQDEDRERALDAGFDSYVSKPVAPETLVRMLDELVKAARL
ncbi:ATP-binding response regulator [Paraburkholderia strydomiana]|uniref:ATP-binding response regulator n=1 Tax=Paraburkholderia strydomiana TaxID=1245417 RepID=UPI0038B73E25